MRVRLVLLGALFTLHVVQARVYSHAWSSNLALWQRAAQVAPMKSRPHLNLSRYLIEERRLDEAWAEGQVADRLLDLPHVSEHERVTRRKALYHNMMMLSYFRQVLERAKS